MRWFRKLINLFRAENLDRDIDRELSFHLIAVILLLSLAAVSASSLPARRASAVDPVEALKAD